MESFYAFGKYGIRGGVSKSNFVDVRFLADLPLVGSNEKASNDWCNVFSKNRVCLKDWLHEGKVCPEDFVGTKPLGGVIGKGVAVVQPHASHCYDPLCPLCCYNWAKKTAKRVMNRFDVFGLVYGSDFELRHIVVSVCDEDYGMPLDFLRKKAIVFGEAVGCVGGLCIYHPKRDMRVSGKTVWYFSPHFHFLAYVARKYRGYVDGDCVAKIQKLTGWVLVNLDERKSIVGTLLYQLSHCGVVGRSKTVNWFGELVFTRKVHADLGEVLRQNELDAKIKGKAHLCPVCGSKMVHGCRSAKAPVNFSYVEFEDEFLLDRVEDWVVVPDVYRARRRKFSVDEDTKWDEYETSDG